MSDYKEIANVELLRPIKAETHYEKVLHEIETLVMRDDLSEDELDYLDLLSSLVEDFEAKHHRIEANFSPVENLKYLLDENGMTASDLGRLLGQRQLGAKILSGQRGLSKAHISALCVRFKVNPSLFFSPPTFEKESALTLESA